MRIPSVTLGPVLVMAFALTAYAFPCLANVRITDDRGGQIGPYLQKFDSLRKSGQTVMIDGPWLSACTMVLGLIPRDHICVTSRARLGFHAAWRPDESGRPVASQDGTDLLMANYPEQVREWIRRHGGLSQHLMYLSGTELWSMYSPAREIKPLPLAASSARHTLSRECSLPPSRQAARPGESHFIPELVLAGLIAGAQLRHRASVAYGAVGRISDLNLAVLAALIIPMAAEAADTCS
jgi:hypothetical protein